MAGKWGFVGPTYVMDAGILGAERAVNVMAVKNEAPTAQSPFSLIHTPGTTATWALPDGPPSALFAQDGRVFCIAGGRFVELTDGGVVIDRGPLARGGSLGSIASNGSGGGQLFAVSGGKGYTYTLATNVLAPIGVAGFPAQAVMGTYIDGYFIVLWANANEFGLSGLLNGTTWSGLDVAQRSSSSDQLVALIQDHRELWLFGTKRIEVWNDIGAANFPFAPNPAGFIEQGAYANTICQFDNTLIWVSQAERGGRKVLRAQGYTPQRVSTHAIERALRRAPTLDTAEAFTYEEDGHEQYVLNMPTSEQTFVLDAATGWWHERDWWNPASGRYERARPRCHCVGFGKHLVGDRLSNVVSVQGQDILTDQGASIHRRRRCPVLMNENKLLTFHRVQLGMQTGDGMAGGVPKSTLRYSDDAARTWSNDLIASLGDVGDYSLQVFWDQLGSGRKRVFEWETADPVPIAITDAYLETGMGRF